MGVALQPIGLETPSARGRPDYDRPPSSDRRGDLLSEAVGVLRHHPERLQRARRRRHEIGVGGGLFAGRQHHIVLEADARVTAEERRGGRARGFPAAERADAPEGEARHVGRDEREEVDGRRRPQEREPSKDKEDSRRLERDQAALLHGREAPRSLSEK